MTRITAIFAALFIINSLALGVLAARGHAPSIVETIEEQQSAVPAVPTVGETKEAPNVPVSGEKKETAPKKAADENE